MKSRHHAYDDAVWPTVSAVLLHTLVSGLVLLTMLAFASLMGFVRIHLGVEGVPDTILRYGELLLTASNALMFFGVAAHAISALLCTLGDVIGRAGRS